MRQRFYDGRQQLTAQTSDDPAGNSLMQLSYQYDPVGNVLQKSKDGDPIDYQYDDLDRLTEAALTQQTEGWQYDPNGNRIQDQQQPGNWQYDDNDQLQAAPNATYTYDQAGNPTQKVAGGQTTTYTYNAENRLTRITQSGITLASYTYDPFGRRIKKATPTETTYYHYNDEGLVGEYDTNGNPIRTYGYAPDSTWTTDPLYQQQNGEIAYYHNDHLGQPQKLVRANGQVVWQANYLAFGKASSIQREGGWDNPLRFPGQYYDSETGTHYNYFRDYDPSTGRYIQSDPIGQASGPNVFIYVANQPVLKVDPLGLRSKKGGKSIPNPWDTGPNAPLSNNIAARVPNDDFAPGDRWGTPALPSNSYVGYVMYYEYYCVRYRYGECGRLEKYWKLVIVNTNTRNRPHGTCVLYGGRGWPLTKGWPTFQRPGVNPIYRDSESILGPSMWSAE